MAVDFSQTKNTVFNLINTKPTSRSLEQNLGFYNSVFWLICCEQKCHFAILCLAFSSSKKKEQYPTFGFSSSSQGWHSRSTFLLLPVAELTMAWHCFTIALWVRGNKNTAGPDETKLLLNLRVTETSPISPFIVTNSLISAILTETEIRKSRE